MVKKIKKLVFEKKNVNKRFITRNKKSNNSILTKKHKSLINFSEYYATHINPNAIRMNYILT
jgi:hypothetical protein